MKTPRAGAWYDGPEAAREDSVNRALLISIQPRFANAILESTKTIELRRTIPTLPPCALALIYSSSPKQALVGWATIEGIVRTTPDALWRIHKDDTGVTSDEFSEYFAGRSHAFGLQLGAAQRADREVSLAALRTHGLQPPQSWRYITPGLAHTLRQEMLETAHASAHEPQFAG